MNIEHINTYRKNISFNQNSTTLTCGAGFMNLFAYQTILHKHEVVKQSKDTINNWRQNEFTK